MALDIPVLGTVTVLRQQQRRPGRFAEVHRASDNFREGQKYGALARGCPPVSAAPGEADRDAFLVVPNTFVPTAWVC